MIYIDVANEKNQRSAWLRDINTHSHTPCCVSIPRFRY